MNLFIVHAGYYDEEIGIYELHTNFLVAAANVPEVKRIMEEKEIFKKKSMHIDAIQEIEMVDGYRIKLIQEEEIEVTKLISYNHTQIKELTKLLS